MPCSPESGVQLESMTLTLDYNDTGVIGSYNVTDTASGSITYTRVKPKRFCGADRSAILASLDPGQFFIDGTPCCPCAGQIFIQPAAAVVMGSRTFAPIGDAPAMDPQDISVTGTWGIDTSFCQSARPTELTAAPDSDPEDVDISITTAVAGGPTRNAEILIQISDPQGFFTGAAEIQWISPLDSSVYTLTLTPDPSTTRNIGSLLSSGFGPSLPDGVVVTADTWGWRLGFSGPFARTGIAPPSIVSNTLQSQALVPVAENFSAEFALTIGGDAVATTPGCAGTNATPCGNSFSASQDTTVGDLSWTAAMEGS